MIDIDSPQACDMSVQSLETSGQRVHVTDRGSLEDMELEMRSFTEPLPTNQQVYLVTYLFLCGNCRRIMCLFDFGLGFRDQKHFS